MLLVHDVIFVIVLIESKFVWSLIDPDSLDIERHIYKSLNQYNHANDFQTIINIIPSLSQPEINSVVGKISVFAL